jgi:hypothetical protein
VSAQPTCSANRCIAWSRGPGPSGRRGVEEVPRGEGFQRVARHRAGRPGLEGKAAVPAGPGGVRGPRRRTRRGARIPGTPAAAHATSRLAIFVRDPQLVRVTSLAAVVFDQVDQPVVLLPATPAGARRRWCGPALLRSRGSGCRTRRTGTRSSPLAWLMANTTQRFPIRPGRAAGPLLILSAAPTQGWESPSDTPIITRLNDCRTRRKRPDPFLC